MIHTPGPWKANCFLVHQAEGKMLEICHTGLVGRNKPGTQAEADAKLIAAAPDLLEAVSQCLLWIEEHEFTHGRNFAAGNVARDAIEKATGVRPAEVV